MKKTEYLIVGLGTAGLGAYSRIRRQTDNYLIAQHGPMGTTCARVGCMPSKMLVTAGELAQAIDSGAYFGVDGSYKINGPRVFERLAQERADKFVKGVLRAVKTIPADKIIEGKAHFVGPRQIQVGDEIISAQKIVLAAGSRPIVPDAFRHVANKVDTTDTIFELNDLPAGLAVVGLGAIAMELGQAFSRLGVKTTLFGRSGRLGPFTHPLLQKEAVSTFAAKLDMVPAGAFSSVTHTESGFHLTYRTAEGEEVVRTVERVLLASGRVSNLLEMNLAAGNIKTDSNGLPTIDAATMTCGELPVTIAGDATGERPLWHEAYDEGRIAADSLIDWPSPQKAVRRVPLGIYYSDPQMAMVGARYADLDPETTAVGSAPFAKGPRHEIYNITEGKMFLFAEKEGGKILGAEIFGAGAEHFAHYLALAITHGLTINQVLEAPFYHPSLEEVLKTALFRTAAQVQSA